MPITPSTDGAGNQVAPESAASSTGGVAQNIILTPDAPKDSLVVVASETLKGSGTIEGDVFIGLIEGMHRGAFQHHQTGAAFCPGKVIGAMRIAKPVAFAQIGHVSAENDPVGER